MITETMSAPRAQVLVIDDDPHFLFAITQDIGALDYQAVPASDPSIALAMLEVRRFQAVVCDVSLSLPDGTVFVVAAATIAPDTPIVIVTGEDSLSRIRSLLDGVPVESIMPKEYTRKEVLDAIDRAVNRAQVNEVDAENETRVIAGGLVRALALRDIETENHSRRVSAWTRLLAKSLEMKRFDLLQCELGALLHDVGKIGVPDAILRKPGKLTDAEWVEIRKHPDYGREMLVGIPQLQVASEIVYSHHERWDGKGYPRGLKGETIHIGARIFAIADTYDAMTSDRPYRKALTHEAAIEELKSLANQQYDPHLVEIFLSLDAKKWRAARDRFEDPPAPKADSSPVEQKDLLILSKVSARPKNSTGPKRSGRPKESSVPPGGKQMGRR
jgi:response regulator RpfG family c-di-GMP phosphodiesterase